MQTKKIVISALNIALGIVLPMALHFIPNAGQVLLPMHLPVLLNGLCCGSFYGGVVGMLIPLLSSILTGMPPAAILPSMVFELAAYGLVSGVMVKVIRGKNELLNTYGALVCSMLVGRIVFGIVNAMVFRAGAYSLEIWVTASFITALPGIILQLVVIPILVVALRKSKLIGMV